MRRPCVPGQRIVRRSRGGVRCQSIKLPHADIPGNRLQEAVHVVDGYRDQAVGVLEKDGSGRLAIVRVTLRPQVRFGGEKTPTPEELVQMHGQAHHACFIANSVNTEVVIEPL